jgi:hypothetical protein
MTHNVVKGTTMKIRNASANLLQALASHEVHPHLQLFVSTGGGRYIPALHMRLSVVGMYGRSVLRFSQCLMNSATFWALPATFIASPIST